MCQSSGCAHRNPINCIVPPHMLRVLELRGDEKQTAMARELMGQGAKVRGERAAKSASPMRRSDDAAAAPYTAEAFATRAAAPRSPKRAIYDGENKAALPGKLVRSEGDAPTGDAAVDDVYDHAGTVYDLYAKKFNRDSIDGNGMTLVQTVHHRRGYNNAFWDGTQMAYGDGDGQIFSTFVEISVIGHEMSHGVVQHSGGLVYEGQSGALNEHFADVFGTITRQWQEKTGACASDWLIGKGILGPEIKGEALRSMRMPGTAYDDPLLGKDPQPYHAENCVSTTDDNGEVHIEFRRRTAHFFLYCMLVDEEILEGAGTDMVSSLR